VELVIDIFMAAMGLGIAAIWSSDIRAGRGFTTSGGLLGARDADSGNVMLPHWLAEYGTAAALLIGATGLVLRWAVRDTLATAALGALSYTALNSLAWVLARPERRAYGIPMAVGLVGGLASIALLVFA
jgi:hypothetical protein